MNNEHGRLCLTINFWVSFSLLGLAYFPFSIGNREIVFICNISAIHTVYKNSAKMGQ